MHARERAEFSITEAAQSQHSQVTGTAGMILSEFAIASARTFYSSSPGPYRDLTFCKFRTLFSYSAAKKRPILNLCCIKIQVRSAHAEQARNAVMYRIAECPANVKRGTSDNQGILQSLNVSFRFNLCTMPSLPSFQRLFAD